MHLTPDTDELLARARSDLRMGLPVVLVHNQIGLVIASAETISSKRMAGLRTINSDLSLVITGRRAETLKARVYDGDIARMALPPDARINWVRSIADPATDLGTPMKGPFTIQRGGDTYLHRLAITLAKSARLLPAVITVELTEPRTYAHTHYLTALDADSVQVKLNETSFMHPVVNARLPLSVSEAGRLHIYRPEDGSEEHYAVEIGKPDRSAPVLARLHSACFTGDLLGSLKCDCGPQLRAALSQMGTAKSGVLLYLNQEGRGIGLANKMRAYSLQDQGFDTVEANHRLGFEDDERDFRIGASLLKQMGFTSVRLLTNNPAKIKMMEQCGLRVTERVPLKVGETAHNQAYLATKVKKSGHML